MAEKRLDRADIVAGFEQMRNELLGEAIMRHVEEQPLLPPTDPPSVAGAVG